MLKIFKKNEKSAEKCFTKQVQSCILLLSTDTRFRCRRGTQSSQDHKMLIIFPLIIYYSGSSKQCLLLFEFLKHFFGFFTQYSNIVYTAQASVFNKTQTELISTKFHNRGCKDVFIVILY